MARSAGSAASLSRTAAVARASAAGRGSGVVPHHQVQVVVDVAGPGVVAVQHPRRVHLAAQVVEGAACADE